MDKLPEQRKDIYFPEDENVVPEFVGKNKKLIILKRPIENVPKGYVQLVIKHQDQKQIALVPAKVKTYMAGGGHEDGMDALDEIGKFYGDCNELEGKLYFDEIFSTPQTEISTLARHSYGVHILNMIVGAGQDGMKFKKGELERLCLTEDYVLKRVKMMASIQLGKTPKELKEENLEHLLVDVTTNVQEEVKKAYKVRCDCGSHIEYRTQYRTETIERQETFEINPKISAIESEIAEYRAKKGVEISPHDAALIRGYANLAFIAGEDPKKSFDISPPEVTKPQDSLTSTNLDGAQEPNALGGGS